MQPHGSHLPRAEAHWPETVVVVAAVPGCMATLVRRGSWTSVGRPGAIAALLASTGGVHVPNG